MNGGEDDLQWQRRILEVGDIINVVTVRTFIADGQNLIVDGDEDLWREVYGA